MVAMCSPRFPSEFVTLYLSTQVSPSLRRTALSDPRPPLGLPHLRSEIGAWTHAAKRRCEGANVNEDQLRMWLENLNEDDTGQ
jgi:hypothetical protein